MRTALCGLLLVASLVVAYGDPVEKKHDIPDPPVWPDQYTVSYKFEVPYVRKLQKESLINKYEVWQDSAGGRQKIVRDSLETVLTLVDEGKRYNIYPAKDEYRCFAVDVKRAPSGPTRRLQSATPGSDAALHVGAHDAEAEYGPDDFPTHANEAEKPKSSYLTFVLPDLRESRWVYKGASRVEGLGTRDVHLYQYEMKEREMEMLYKFYVSHEGVPLRLWQLGQNLYSGGHKDLYISDYYDYRPVKRFDADTFRVPDWGHCDGSSSPYTTDALGPVEGMFSELQRSMPSVHWGDAAYDAFAHAHRRRVAHSAEYHARRREYHANRARLAELEAAGKVGASARGHRVRLNHFADWTEEEFNAVMNTDAGSGVAPGDLNSLPMHQRTLPNHLIPAQLSWKGQPIDSPVKDQGACGSCWTFSTVAAIEAAYYRATGRARLFSEQNLIDCSWVVTNRGCYGGRQIVAFDWVFNTQGGLATAQEYPYRGLNDWCRPDVPRVNLTGHAVQVEANNHEALKDAVATKGPITVSVDAADPGFKFYAGGVYRRPGCGKGRLNHAVIVSGYGTTDDGDDYWLVKNMWSPYWGEDGYIRIARHPDDCGISQMPVYVEMQVHE